MLDIIAGQIVGTLRCVNENRSAISGRPGAVLDVLKAAYVSEAQGWRMLIIFIASRIAKMPCYSNQSSKTARGEFSLLRAWRRFAATINQRKCVRLKKRRGLDVELDRGSRINPQSQIKLNKRVSLSMHAKGVACYTGNCPTSGSRLASRRAIILCSAVLF